MAKVNVGIIGTGWGARVQVPTFREAGLNVSEFVRRAATGVADDDDELLGLLDRTERAAKEGIALIDDAVDFVKASNVRIARMEAEAKSS